MNPGIRILSTRKLNDQQRKLFINAGFEVMDKDFIKIINVDFQVKEIPSLLLFTSKNAVKSFAENKNFPELANIPAVCVGSKTAGLLTQNNIEVLAGRDCAEALRDEVLPDFKNEEIAFFSGNRRMGTLPEWLEKNRVRFTEYTVYETVLQPEKIEEPVQGILFYSPSGVESFLQSNQIKDEICFCIGRTTAAALKGITESIVIADRPYTENVISRCISFFSGNSGKN